VFEAAAARHPDVVFGKIDTEAEPDLSEAFQIRAIPTLMVLRDGVLLASESGAMPGEMIDEIVGAARAVDMDKLRREIEAETAAAGQDESRG
jgi:thioredoxin 1